MLKSIFMGEPRWQDESTVEGHVRRTVELVSWGDDRRVLDARWDAYHELAQQAPPSEQRDAVKQFAEHYLYPGFERRHQKFLTSRGRAMLPLLFSLSAEKAEKPIATRSDILSNFDYAAERAMNYFDLGIIMSATALIPLGVQRTGYSKEPYHELLDILSTRGHGFRAERLSAYAEPPIGDIPIIVYRFVTRWALLAMAADTYFEDANRLLSGTQSFQNQLHSARYLYQMPLRRRVDETPLSTAIQHYCTARIAQVEERLPEGQRKVDSGVLLGMRGMMPQFCRVR